MRRAKKEKTIEPKRKKKRKTLEIIPILCQANRQMYNDSKLPNERTFASTQRELTNIRMVTQCNYVENCPAIRSTYEQNESKKTK